MFKSFFKRAVKPAAAPVPASPDTSASSAAQKQQALEQAAAVAGDEAAAVEFILQSNVADARLTAIAHVHSKAALERLLPAMRNIDRRVARRIQGRLDELAQQQRTGDAAAAIVAQAQALAQDRQPMANQVADLDRAWQAVVDAPPGLAQQFAQARDTLAARLQAQATLQRSVLDTLATLRKLSPESVTEPGQYAQQLSALQEQMQACMNAPEAASLPKHLQQEFTQLHATLASGLAQIEKRQAAIAARRGLLDEWESADRSVLQTADLRRAWQATPVDDDTTQQRFDALLQTLAPAPAPTPAPATKKPKTATTETPPAATRQQFVDALERLEQALEEGSLQLASDQDKQLRAIDIKSVRADDAQQARLARARAELARLQGWARWGGNVSRDELLHDAENLPAAGLSLTELAKRVGSLRERWKLLDATAGPSGKEMWTRFDVACSAAYAPVAEHFKQLAEERRQNLQKAEALLDEVRAFTVTGDWKAAAAFCTRTTQAWQRLGTIDRKERKRLEREFKDAMQHVSAPLTQQRQTDVKLREDLIARVANLGPDDRNALDTLRACQEEWQQHARAVPLERKQEQALWTRFRAACDAVFARRKEASAAADTGRRQHLQQKEELCAALEAAVDMPEAAMRKSIAESNAAWSRIGPVPRAAENALDARHARALAALNARLDRAAADARAAEGRVLLEKLLLCHAAETAPAPDLAARWQALPPVSESIERVLRQRFEAAVPQPEGNRALLASQLLRLEILCGIESPPALSRERLQLQVEVLQSSLQAGAKPLSAHAQLLSLCALPAPIGPEEKERLERIVAVAT